MRAESTPQIAHGYSCMYSRLGRASATTVHTLTGPGAQDLLAPDPHRRALKLNARSEGGGARATATGPRLYSRNSLGYLPWVHGITTIVNDTRHEEI